MSEPGTGAAAGSPDFSELWRKISEADCNKSQERRGGQHMAATATSPGWNDLQSPRLRGCSRLSGSNTAESPGDGEASQDIFWDGASPTPAGSGNKNTRAVKISDIVNRIAPKNIKPKVDDSSLLHWIDDGAIPYTPDVPKQRARKRSSRQSSVEDLMKLAKQFDKNMQQDEETSVRPNTVTGKLSEAMRDPKCPSSLEQAEAELQALFDSSTQKVSGRLSKGSASASSQDRKDQSAADKISTDNLVDFEDEWDNDDLLNDSLILALTQDPNRPPDANPMTSVMSHANNKTLDSVLQPATSLEPAHKPVGNLFSSLQDLCPKAKTTNRSTFRLEPNPHFQARLVKEASRSSFTHVQAKSKSTEQKGTINGTTLNPQPDKVTSGGKCFLQAPPVKDISDSLWGDGNDDALFYQLCDSMEMIPNSQPKEAGPKLCHQNSTDHFQVNRESSRTSGVCANRRSSGSFVRSNSLPLTTCETGNYRGWSIPLKGGDQKSGISQSFPGGQVGLGEFNHGREFSRTVRTESSNAAMNPHTATTRAPQNSTSHHAAFKRNVSDLGVTSNKVFVTSQTTGKCSAAEIERKKQEALARRRLRTLNQRGAPS